MLTDDQISGLQRRIPQTPHDGLLGTLAKRHPACRLELCSVHLNQRDHAPEARLFAGSTAGATGRHSFWLPDLRWHRSLKTDLVCFIVNRHQAF